MKYDSRNATLTVFNVQPHHHNITIQCVLPRKVTPSNITKLYIVNPTTTTTTDSIIQSPAAQIAIASVVILIYVLSLKKGGVANHTPVSKDKKITDCR